MALQLNYTTNGYTEGHDLGFEESFIGFKSGFPFVTFLDSDIVIPPTNVILGESSFADKLANKFFNEWDGVSVAYGDFV